MGRRGVLIRIHKIWTISTHHSDRQFSPGACARDHHCPYYLPWAFTMTAKDPSELVITNIVATTIECVQNPQNDDVPDVEDFDDDASVPSPLRGWIVCQLGIYLTIPQPDRRTKWPWKLPTRAPKTA